LLVYGDKWMRDRSIAKCPILYVTPFLQTWERNTHKTSCISG